MFKTLTALTALTSLSLSAIPASANNVDGHNQLLSTVTRAGISVYINPDVCDTRSALGWYTPSRKVMVICQENKVHGSNEQVYWTAEDYDTVRHEVHHVAQDCVDGSINGKLESVYNNPIHYGVHVLGQDFAAGIAKSYGEKGASEHIQVLEIEAFAVAHANNTASQVADLQRYCF